MTFLWGGIAGAVGGLVATLAMNKAQRQWTLAADGQPPVSAAGEHDARDWQERDEGRNSNELAAQRVAAVLLERPLTTSELAWAAPLIHFSFGAAVGALYGVYADARAEDGRSGLAFGMTVWLLADEIAMPLLRLSGSTLQRPLEMHLQSLAAHLVFGLAAEGTRRTLRSALPHSRRTGLKVA